MKKYIPALAVVGAMVSVIVPRMVFAQGCYDSSIMSPTPFMGNNGEIFRLADGSIWEVKYEYEYLYEYYPKVTVCPGRRVLIVRGKALNVQQVSPETRPSPPPAQAGSARPGRSPQLDVLRDDDFSFYDSRGRAAAYFEPSGELTVYLWSGEPVAYLYDDSLYGFNGKHLGWYHNGLMYDHDGGIVVAPASAFRESPGPAPLRSLKGLKPLKGLKELRPLKPLFGLGWSPVPASVFFLRGVD